MMAPNPACVAYEAYRDARNADKTTNVYLLGWDMLTEVERQAWWAVVRSFSTTRFGGVNCIQPDEKGVS